MKSRSLITATVVLCSMMVVQASADDICGTAACEIAKQHETLASCKAQIGALVENGDASNARPVWVLQVEIQQAVGGNEAAVLGVDLAGNYLGREEDNHNYRDCPNYPSCPEKPDNCK
jgi:protein subunit release factor A